MQKGISPLVATVLLIAITMTLAGIVAFWGSSFVRTSLPTGNQTQNIQACAACLPQDLELFSYSYNAQTNSLDLTLNNKCTYSLMFSQIVFKYGDGSTEIKNVNSEIPYGLSKKSITGVPSGFNSFMITTNCKEIFLNVSVG